MTNKTEQQLMQWVDEHSGVSSIDGVDYDLIDTDEVRKLFRGMQLVPEIREGIVPGDGNMTNARLHGCEFDGWQCFHCSEVFTTVGGAADHFGATPDAKPGCLIRVQLGNERGLEMEVRRLEDEVDSLRAALNKIARTPNKPFPDAGAHSWEAFGRAVFVAYCDMNREARAALSSTGAKGEL